MFNNLVLAGDTANTKVFIAIAILAIILVVVLALTGKKKDSEDKKDK